MMKTYNMFDDRRRNLRKNIKIDVQLKIGIHLKGPGYTHNISPNGLVIKSPEIFCFFKPELAHAFENADMTVTFSDESLTVQGTIVRIDTSKEELAVRITQTSNDNRWKLLSE